MPRPPHKPVYPAKAPDKPDKTGGVKGGPAPAEAPREGGMIGEGGAAGGGQAPLPRDGGMIGEG